MTFAVQRSVWGMFAGIVITSGLSAPIWIVTMMRDINEFEGVEIFKLYRSAGFLVGALLLFLGSVFLAGTFFLTPPSSANHVAPEFKLQVLLGLALLYCSTMAYYLLSLSAHIERKLHRRAVPLIQQAVIVVLTPTFLSLPLLQSKLNSYLASASQQVARPR